MRIINSVYGDSTGGRWNATLKTAELLASVGHEVILLIAPEDESKVPASFSKAVRVLTLKNHGHYDPLASWRARKIIRAEKIDLCICHSGRAIYMLKRAAPKHVPVVAFNHSHNIKRTLKADAFFCITPYMKKIIDERTGGSKPSFVISNAVTLPPIEALSSAPRPVFTIGAITRMAPNKGLRVLVDALGLLHKQDIDFRARIAGDGEDRELLGQMVADLQIADKVEFVGWISEKEKLAFFNSVDVMCFTSEWDVQPLVILESFAYAKPLIGTDVDGPSSMYVHEETALVVPPKEPMALGQALIRLQSDVELRGHLARKGRLKAEHEHADQYIAVLLSRRARQILIG